MAEVTAKPKPGVRVFQEFSDEESLLRRPILQPAVIAQAFQLVGKVLGDAQGAVAGVYTGDEILNIAYPDLLSEAEVDNFAATYEGSPDLLDEVIVEIDDVNGTFDVSDDDEVVIDSAGVDLGKALTVYKQILGGTIVTTELGLKRLTFPSSIDLFALGARVGDFIRFATGVADLIDPARSAPSSEIDPLTGLSQDFQIIGIPARNVVDVQIEGSTWAGFDGETAVQAEVRRYPAGTGVLIAPHEDGAGISLTATTTLVISNAGVNFLGSRPVQPGDCIEFTSSQDAIVGDAAVIVDNVEAFPTTLVPTTSATTPAGTTLAPTTLVVPPIGSGVLGMNVPILAGNILSDADGDFISAGVTSDMYLRFVQEVADLDGVFGVVVTRNVKDIRISSVTAGALTLATALISEAPTSGKSFQYQIIRKNQPVAVADNIGPIRIVGVLGPQSLELETSLAIEAATLSREFEFTITRKRVPTGDIRISYRALRGDLTGTFTEVQADPTQGMTQLVGAVGPIVGDEKNPLGLMAAMCALQTTDAIAAVAVKHWTLAEVGDALDVLGTQPQVYGIAIGTQDPTLNSLVIAHVEKFSAPAERLGLERYAALSYRFPFQDAVLAVQTGSTALLEVQGDRTRVKIPSGAAYTFAEVKPNHVLKLDPSGLGTTFGFNVGGAEVERNEVRVIAVIGTDTLVLAEEIHTSEGSTIAGPWRIDTHVREKFELAAIIANFNASIANRRIESVFPADVKANVDGSEEVLPSYYYCAGSIGLRAAQAPGNPMTFAPTAGFSGTVGGQDVFSEEHFNIMAGGGTWIIIQEAPGAPVAARHQLTTDTASLIRSESSIRTALDFTAKMFRSELRPLIGRRNLTQKFITQELRPRAEAILSSLIADNVLDTDSSIIKVERDPNKSDRVIFTVRTVTLKPYNEGDVILAIE